MQPNNQSKLSVNELMIMMSRLFNSYMVLWGFHCLCLALASYLEYMTVVLISYHINAHEQVKQHNLDGIQAEGTKIEQLNYLTRAVMELQYFINSELLDVLVLCEVESDPFPSGASESVRDKLIFYLKPQCSLRN